jgi:hypothetical protein
VARAVAIQGADAIGIVTASTTAVGFVAPALAVAIADTAEHKKALKYECSAQMSSKEAVCIH